MALYVPIEDQQCKGTSLRSPSVPRRLTYRQAPRAAAASSASAELVTAVVQGLQVVAEGTDPTIEYVTLLPYCSIDS
jgi:hypothetical protein